MTAMHPLPKLAVCLVFVLASILVFDLRVQIAILLLAVAACRVGAGIPLRRIALLLLPFCLFGFGFLTTSVLFRAESGYAVQMAAEQGGGAPDLSPGLVLFFRVLACGMVSAAFVLSTDPGRFVRALMTDLALPPAVGFALLQALHLVPDLRREAQVLRMARAIRLGRPMRRLPTPNDVAALAVPLLAFAIRRAGRAAIALEARGLAAGRRRTHLPQPAMGRRDAAFVVASVAVLGGLLAVL